MTIAVFFDAFGTIVSIGQRANPYTKLFQEGRRQGRTIGPDTTRIAMTADVGLDELASRLEIKLTASLRDQLHQRLDQELSSIELYPDALESIARLRDAGVRVGVCSNLAMPYGPVVRELLPNLDGYAFSYELGVMKPEKEIYTFLCKQIGVEPGHGFHDGGDRIFMIGDSQRCDRDGPRAAGIMGFHLDRRGQGGIRDLLQFAQLVIDQVVPAARRAGMELKGPSC